MGDQPTANFVSGKLVTCYRASCDIYNNGMWTELVKTRVSRIFHSSVQTEEQILLIGGLNTQASTEWIPLDGSPSQPGPFQVRHGEHHCTIQVSPDTIVLTGGDGRDGSEDYVTEYQLTGDGADRELNGMITPRYQHACGHYLDADGQQVRTVKSGFVLIQT